MPRPRSTMRQTRELLRLTLGEGMSCHRAGVATGMPYSTAKDCVSRARAAGLTWPLPEEMDDRDLEDRLYTRRGTSVPRGRPEPDWAEAHKELRRKKSVTLQLLWIEYKQRDPSGYQYTQFCHRYHQWAARLDVVMRQDHKAGERTFLDFAGQTLPITDPKTGVVSQAQLFVATLGASSYTYAEALASQELPLWVGANVRMFEFFGGATQILVPDNLLSAVTKAHRYEPKINRTYREMAAHYGCAVIPARPYKPRDKAKVEAAVLLAERWILASLRNRTFFSIGEANVAIAEQLEVLNNRPFKKIAGSRRSLFEALDRPALRSLPERRYEYATWKWVTVNIDYHVEVDLHYYSVPYQLARQKCETRVSATTVEVFHRGRRVASHRRSFARRGHTTLAEHMPESHRRYQEWTPGRIVRWAEKTGPQTAALVDTIMRSRPHPEQGFRTCLGILRLEKRYGSARLEAACARGVAIRTSSYRSLESILKNGLDSQPLPQRAAPITPYRRHAYVRGATYYQ